MLEQFPPINSGNAEEVLAHFTGIVFAYNKLCPHCKVMSTILEKVQAIQPIPILTLDSEEELDLMKQFNVESVPTLVVFKNGVQKATKTGIMNPRETLDYLANARFSYE